MYKGYKEPNPINSNWLSLALLEVTGRCQNMVISIMYYVYGLARLFSFYNFGDLCFLLSMD